MLTIFNTNIFNTSIFNGLWSYFILLPRWRPVHKETMLYQKYLGSKVVLDGKMKHNHG